MESSPPDKIQNVIQRITPPKGIRRKNLERSELLDFFTDDAAIEPDEPEVSEAEDENDDDQLEKAAQDATSSCRQQMRTSQ